MSRTNNRTRTRVLEEMTFHSSGGSLTVRVIEKEKGDFKTDPDEAIRRDHRLEITHGSHLGYTTNSFPIGAGAIAHYISDALKRTAHYIDAVGTGPGYQPFDKLTEKDVIQVRSGLRQRRVYREEIVVSPHETYAAYVGLEWLDSDGAVANFEPAQPRDHHLAEPRAGWGGYSTEARYAEEEVGLSIAQVNQRRRELRQEPGCAGLYDLIPVKHQSKDYRTVPIGRGIRDDGKECDITPFTLPPQATDAEIMEACQFMFDHSTRSNLREMQESIMHLGNLDQERYEELRDKQQFIDQKG